MDRVTISAGALRQILQALIGPGHLIRELQATRNTPGFENPINTVLDEYNRAVEWSNRKAEREKKDG